MSQNAAPQSISFDQAVEVIRARGEDTRTVTAIVGPPAAGKSTITAALARDLNRGDPGSAAVLQMDGFHYDDAVLRSRGLLQRKGAPQTFDTGGLFALLVRLRDNAEDEIAVPVFDRTIEVARAGASIIPSSVRHILLEGNYLLLREAAWNRLESLYDTTIFITADSDLVRERLVARWQGAGLPDDIIAARIEGNDMLNVHTVLTDSSPAEFELAGRFPSARES